MRRVALLALVAFGLAACEGASYGVGVGYPYGYYGYDYGFRTGIYGVHHDVDVDVNLPDRPRPPGGIGNGGNRPATLPAYVGPRPGGGAHAGRPGGGRPGGGRAPRRMR